MGIVRGIIGLAFFCLAAWALSSHRKRVPWRIVVFGLAMQLLLAWLILGTSLGQQLFEELSTAVRRLISMAEPGTQLVFGPLADRELMATAFGEKNAFIFAFAGMGLAAIIFFSALMAVLYHLGLMQLLVYALARLMTAVLGVSGAESMAMAANVFVGQREDALVVRPYIDRMTLRKNPTYWSSSIATTKSHAH